MTSKQIQGYRAQLVGAINRDRTGSIVELDITSAKKIVEALDMLIHLEKNFEGKVA